MYFYQKKDYNKDMQIILGKQLSKRYISQIKNEKYLKSRNQQCIKTNSNLLLSLI